jgi:hypothetical protein
METAKRGLSSNEFVDYPGIQTIELGGRGNPKAYVYTEDKTAKISYYDQLKAILAANIMPADMQQKLKKAFTAAEAGDDEAKDLLDEYLSREDVRQGIKRMFEGLGSRGVTR